MNGQRNWYSPKWPNSPMLERSTAVVQHLMAAVDLRMVHLVEDWPVKI